MNYAEDQHPLDRLIRRETCIEIVKQLSGKDWLIVKLRLDDLTDRQIARRLDIKPSALGMRMMRARQRILREVPDAVPLVAGRRLRRRSVLKPPGKPPRSRK